MVEIYIVIDESGAKGKSNKDENHIGEFGVMAGFISFQRGIEFLRSYSNQIIKSFEKNGKKLHVTDLPPENREVLKDKIFLCMQQHKIPWAYAAAYVNGFFHFNDFEDRPRLLHAQLFSELFFKLLCFTKVRFPDEEIVVNVITDTIQEKTKREFENKINEKIVYFTKGEHTSIAARYNANTKKREFADIRTKLQPEVFENIRVPSIKYDISIEDTSLTLIADVLVNSVFRHINSKLESSKESKVDLNSCKMVEGHPLSSTCYGCSSDEVFSYSDIAFYRREGNPQ